MGCVLCNIFNCETFGTEKKPEPNPFYCETAEEREQFLDELAHDIVTSHPEMVARINAVIVKKGEADHRTQSIGIRDCFKPLQTVLVRTGKDWVSREILGITVLRKDTTCQQCGMPTLGEPRFWFKDHGNIPLEDIMAKEDIDPNRLVGEVKPPKGGAL